jgi:acyl-CoA synthetase (AMP-forming)/AMP-acid ligase II
MNVLGCNVARHLREAAQRTPNHTATLTPLSVDTEGKVVHARCSFARLDQESDAAARAFHAQGITQGTRTLLAVKPGHDLIISMFGLLKLGAVPIAIDPGMGWKKMLACIQQSKPIALVAIPKAYWLSYLPLSAFSTIKHRLAVGNASWQKVIEEGFSSSPLPLAEVQPKSLAAILFTSGSTGAPKGVCYTHGIFDAQIRLIKETYRIEPGEVDMAMLPVFALFNPALGMTTVTPLLDPSRPTAGDPAPLVSAIQSEKVTNSFGSPAIWSRIAHYCLEQQKSLPSLRRLLIAGAPVPPRLLEQLRRIAPHCQIFTPYGATECLPVSSIESSEILSETYASTLLGLGTCVGRPVAGVEIQIIQEKKGVIHSMQDAEICPAGMIGEIIVTGPSVTSSYDHLPEATERAKIRDGEKIWHRMGDLGRLDTLGRLWFHGRCIEKVETPLGSITTESIEPLFREHEAVERCAFIGIGKAPQQTPVLVVELKPEHAPLNSEEKESLLRSLRQKASNHPLSLQIKEIVFQDKLPVDVRHNAKIHRLQLAREWTQKFGQRSF